MVGVSSRTSCRQLFKELNILMVGSLYIFELTCFIKKYCHSLELNSNVHKYNMQRMQDIHIKLQKIEIYKKSVIDMGTKVNNNLPKYLKEIDDYKVKTHPSSPNVLFSKRICIFLVLPMIYIQL